MVAGNNAEAPRSRYGVIIISWATLTGLTGIVSLRNALLLPEREPWLWNRCQPCVLRFFLTVRPDGLDAALWNSV